MWSILGGIIGWILRLIFPRKSSDKKLGRAEAELDAMKKIREKEEAMNEVPRASRSDAVSKLRKNGL